MTITAGDDGSVEILLERHNPVTGVPSAVKKLTGDWQHVIERMTWGPERQDGSRVAPHTTEFVGLPAGDARNPDPDPERRGHPAHPRRRVKSGVPLVGGKLESTAIDETRSSMDAGGEAAVRYTG